MLKLSRFILCVLIGISFLYKSVCSSEETENGDSNITWKTNNSQYLQTLIELVNTLYDDNGDGIGHNQNIREQWRRLQVSTPQGNRPKRPNNDKFVDIGDTYSNLYDEILKIPLQNWDLRKLEKYPLVKEFIARNGSLLSNLEDKQNLIYTPRPGRAVHNDDCVEIVRFRPPYAPRLGKKSVDNFSPRLGRHCSESLRRRK